MGGARFRESLHNQYIYVILHMMYNHFSRWDSISVDTSASFRATWTVNRHGPCSNLYKLHIMSFSNSSSPGDHLS